jgi:hypothetical protein
MLDPQVVVNLLPKLGVGVDLVRLGRRSAGRFGQLSWSIDVLRSETNEFHKRLFLFGLDSAPDSFPYWTLVLCL